MIEKENKDIYDYADEAYEYVVNKYLENEVLDRDIDDIAKKFENIILDICFDYIMYDDLAEELLMGSITDLTEFAYYMDHLGVDVNLMELVEEPLKFCNFYLTDILWRRLGEVLTSELEKNIKEFEDEYSEKHQELDSKEVEERYRKMVTDTLLNSKYRLITLL